MFVLFLFFFSNLKPTIAWLCSIQNYIDSIICNYKRRECKIHVSFLCLDYDTWLLATFESFSRTVIAMIVKPTVCPRKTCVCAYLKTYTDDNSMLVHARNCMTLLFWSSSYFYLTVNMRFEQSLSMEEIIIHVQVTKNSKVNDLETMLGHTMYM